MNRSTDWHLLSRFKNIFLSVPGPGNSISLVTVSALGRKTTENVSLYVDCTISNIVKWQSGSKPLR